MTANPPQIPLDLGHELVIDLFAGGGGTGMEAAIGRPVEIAVNHDPQAIALHQANHPHTEHFCESVFKVNPAAVTRGQPAGLLRASPDCTHNKQGQGWQAGQKADTGPCLGRRQMGAPHTAALHHARKRGRIP